MFDLEQEDSIIDKKINSTFDIHNKVELEHPLSLEEVPYLPPSWEHYLDLLQDLCHHRNVLIAITAPTGAGKTTLMCQFIELIHNGDLTHSLTHSETLSSNLHICTSPYAQTCQVFAHSDLDKQQFLTLITEGFNLPPALGDTLDERLFAQIERLQNTPYPCLLLIDNAENLPAETINTIFTLISQQSDAQMRLHVILFGSPALQNTLNILVQDPTNVALLLMLPLTPFSLEETKKYIEQQLEKNTFPTTANLTPPIVETIYKLSEGIPARINNIAPRLLIASEHTSSGNTMNYLDKIRIHQTKLIGGLVALTLIAVSSYLLAKKSNTTLPPANAAAIIAADEAATKAKDLQTELAIQSQQPQPAAPAVDPNIVALHPQAKPIPTPPAPSAPISANTVAAPTPPPVAKPIPAPIVSNKPAKPSYTTDEKYLLRIGAENYTVQLAAANKSKLSKAINANHLNRHVHYFSEKTKIALAYGVYSSYDAAKAEIQNLPGDLHQFHPAVKKFKDIHKEIKLAGR